MRLLPRLVVPELSRIIEGITTTKSRRVVWLFAEVLALLSMFASPTQTRADIIYDNFPGDRYISFTGWTVGLGAGQVFEQGEGFRPAGNDFSLSRIELGLGLLQGPNEIDVRLMSDAGGAPGSVIEAFHLSGVLGPWPGVNPPVVVDSILHPILTAGEQYWIVLSATSPDTTAVWGDNSFNIFGPHAIRRDGLPWNVLGNAISSAFRVSGTPLTPIPEPAGLLSLGVGLLILGSYACWRRRRLGATLAAIGES